MSKEYSKGKADYSVTEILKSPKQIVLGKRHWTDLEEDVSDRVKAWIGTSVHKALAKSDQKQSGIVSEGRLSIPVGWFTLSGEADYYDSETKTIADYKTTSVYSWIYESRNTDFELQLNLYAYLFRYHGFEVERLQIVYIFTDWSKTKSKRELNYPESPIMVKEFPLWKQEAIEEYLTDRITKIDLANTSKTLPDCTPEERWEKPASWAIFKPGNKRATKVCNSEQEAHEYLDTNKGKFEIVYRPGESTRCKEYCNLLAFCEQGQKLIGGSDASEETSTEKET